MDNHPIPQDVTGFQFKLIGNMTIKQFAYLATGIVLGWVFLQIPVSIFIKLPLSLFFAILGTGLAFFPISGRPMDAMIGNYIKALLKPTQFIYEKTGGQLYFPNTKVPFTPTTLPFQQKDKLKAYLQSQALRKNKIDEKEDNFLTSVASLATNPTLSMPNVSTFKPAPAAVPAAEIQVQQIPAAKVETKPIMPFTKSFNKGIGIPSAPESPNLITGITKDARGNALANILVEVKDKEGNPVRAFKTNEFGRFASATPLMNGSYTIEFEDTKSQNKFKKGIINVSGQIIQPIEVISLDAREELRKSLFSPDASGLNN